MGEKKANQKQSSSGCYLSPRLVSSHRVGKDSLTEAELLFHQCETEDYRRRRRRQRTVALGEMVVGCSAQARYLAGARCRDADRGPENQRRPSLIVKRLKPTLRVGRTVWREEEPWTMRVPQVFACLQSGKNT